MSFTRVTHALLHCIVSDEAELAVILLSDWLELDAPDDWIRHDAEMVRPHAVSPQAQYRYGLARRSCTSVRSLFSMRFPIGSAARTGVRVLFKRPHRDTAPTAKPQ